MTTTFHTTTEHDELLELYKLPGSEWGGSLSPHDFAVANTKGFEMYSKQNKKPRGFFFRNRSTKEIIASLVITRFSGYYKAIDTAAIQAHPDPSTIGVQNATFLLISFVFTGKEYRGQGLAESLIQKAIEFTENELIQENLAKSSDKADGFKNLVTDKTTGEIDHTLANYYLSKKYFWYLYSAVGSFYERFGFKAYPLDFYHLPNINQSDLIDQMIKGSANDASVVGKKLRFLRTDNAQDKGFIEFILQNKEMELIADLNRSIGHSELSGNRRSSSSLTNVSEALVQTKLTGSTNALACIGEASTIEKVTPTHETGKRRSSVAVQQTIPKVALKPDPIVFEEHSANTLYSSEHSQFGETPEQVEYKKIVGAVLENSLQQKTYYVLWAELQNKFFTIVSMGEVKSDFFSSVFESTLGKRRGSSFTGLNELGGYNFQDLDILLNAAGYVANKRKLDTKRKTFVAVHDLPPTIPAPVLHDYFMNYVNSQITSNEEKVTFINDAEEKLAILPMLKRFGNNSPNFDLDWMANSMISWG